MTSSLTHTRAHRLALILGETKSKLLEKQTEAESFKREIAQLRAGADKSGGDLREATEKIQRLEAELSAGQEALVAGQRQIQESNARLASVSVEHERKQKESSEASSENELLKAQVDSLMKETRVKVNHGYHLLTLLPPCFN